jgi:hypothetical protein
MGLPEGAVHAPERQLPAAPVKTIQVRGVVAYAAGGEGGCPSDVEGHEHAPERQLPCCHCRFRDGPGTEAALLLCLGTRCVQVLLCVVWCMQPHPVGHGSALSFSTLATWLAAAVLHR